MPLFLASSTRKYILGKLLFIFVCTSGLFLFYHYQNKSRLVQVQPTEHTKLQNHYELVNERDVFGVNVVYSNSSVRLKTFFNTTLYPPGVILPTKGKGGIGNQLFQYACSYAIAKDLGWPLYVRYDDPPSYRRSFHPGVRHFALDQFQIHLDNIIDKSTNLSTAVISYRDREFFERTFLNKKDPGKQFVQLASGSCCQSIEYWENRQEEIRAMFKIRKSAIDLPKLQKMINKIANSKESVVVHIRRGDFKESFFVPMSFQRMAMRKIISILNARGKEQPVFFVFSDDINHAQKKLMDFAKKYKVVFVRKEITNSTSIEDFYLMTSCKHIIFPNSTYSWWAAYLIKENKEKIVITTEFNPRYLNALFRDSFFVDIHGKMYHPKEWIVLNPFTGGLVKNVNESISV